MAESTKQTVEDRARAVCEPLLAGEGYELVELEWVREHSWILRLFIDKTGSAELVGIEDCEKASRAVDTALEVEDFIPHEYSLEVSSPGLNRPLRKHQHFQKVIGKKVKVKTFGPLSGIEPPRKNFSGVLKDVQSDAVTVNVEGAGDFRIPLKDIAKANLEFEF